MREQIIVSLTTWSKRIQNIPTVLDTIFAQTLPPDLIVLNLAYEEQILYKKLIPTLKRYPNDCIISIDDDWLYPKEMIADFMSVHKEYPNNPISGNREIIFNMQCHCGCASLTKAEFYSNYLDTINEQVIENCPSDDIVYTYFANKAGFPYIRSNELYFTNMTPLGSNYSYSKEVVFANSNGIKETYNYLVKEYGELNDFISQYINDKRVSKIIHDIYCKSIILETTKARKMGHYDIYCTKSYIPFLK